MAWWYVGKHGQRTPLGSMVDYLDFELFFFALSFDVGGSDEKIMYE